MLRAGCQMKGHVYIPHTHFYYYLDDYCGLLGCSGCLQDVRVLVGQDSAQHQGIILWASRIIRERLSSTNLDDQGTVPSNYFISPAKQLSAVM